MQILLINKNDIKGISFGFLNQRNYNLEQEKESIKKGDFNYSIDYNTTLKPFEYKGKGKFYSDLAIVTSNKFDDELEVNQILITEVKDKDEQITLDDRSQFDDNHIINYEDTTSGKEEQKEEDESIDKFVVICILKILGSATVTEVLLFTDIGKDYLYQAHAKDNYTSINDNNAVIIAKSTRS
ncbi:hypothetical protein [Staphylococcus simulans]|uniref:hypothetical protein n=1 Tax=Staphylococcus simulans TaxID=1286 RepID=UPI003CFB34E7